MDFQRTRGGLRLSQHGVVVSEIRLRPGPTHSVFDLLAALVSVARPIGRVGILGFAGGGMIAPLRRLGFPGPVVAVDLDCESHGLFVEHCGLWAGLVEFHHGDAVEWLRSQRSEFGVLVEDLSIPSAGDVFKPEVCWEVLPRLMGDRLVPGGVAILNQLPCGDGTWPRTWEGLELRVGPVLTVRLDDFENRIVVAGSALGSARALGAQVRAALRRLGSKQADRFQIRSGIG